jgi:hypothetical protein
MKKSELKQLIKEELNKDKSKKNRFLGIFGPSKDVFQRIIKNINSIDNLIKYTESNGDEIEKIGKDMWGITKYSGENNEAVWKYVNGDLYFQNPNFPSIYDDYIRKNM